jgi:hypothetical protein
MNPRLPSANFETAGLVLDNQTGITNADSEIEAEFDRVMASSQQPDSLNVLDVTLLADYDKDVQTREYIPILDFPGDDKGTNSSNFSWSLILTCPDI